MSGAKSTREWMETSRAGHNQQLGRIPTLGSVFTNVAHSRRSMQPEPNIRRCLANFFVTNLGWFWGEAIVESVFRLLAMQIFMIQSIQSFLFQQPLSTTILACPRLHENASEIVISHFLPLRVRNQQCAWGMGHHTSHRSVRNYSPPLPLTTPGPNAVCRHHVFKTPFCSDRRKKNKNCFLYSQKNFPHQLSPQGSTDQFLFNYCT